MRMQSPSPHAPRTFRVSHSGPFNHSFQYEGWQIDLHLQCTWEIMKEAPSNKVFTPSNHPRSDIGTSPSQDPSMRPDLHVIHPQWQSNPPNYPTHVTLQTSRTEKSLRNF
jgi:hypothetical protein